MPYCMACVHDRNGLQCTDHTGALPPELQEAIDRFEAPGSDAADEARIAEELRRAAEEHADLRRRSRERGNQRVYCATDAPPVLTPETIDRLIAEGQAISSAFMRRTASMEQLTPEELAIRVR